jgi:hypothetical protein
MLAVDWMTGAPSGSFTWQAFAQVYDRLCPPAQPDVSGCFYDLRDGAIIEGGSVAVTAGNDCVLNEDGSGGCYHIVCNQTGTVGFEAAPPPDCVLAEGLGIGSLDCPDKGTYDPAAGEVQVLGALEDPSNPGFLTSNTCTDWYSSIMFVDGGHCPVVVANNIPLVCPTGNLSTRTIGYWKNHSAEAAPYLPIVLGWSSSNGAPCVTVAVPADVVKVLKGASSRNATSMLRAQLLAAKLDVAIGDVSGEDLVAVAELIVQADELLGRNSCMPLTGMRGADRAQAISLIEALTAFTNKYGG